MGGVPLSNVSGLVNVSLGFSDSTAQPTKSVLKTLSLLEESEGLTGKIAIVSGTVGTAEVTVTPAYRNTSGEVVSFAERGGLGGYGGIDRVAISTASTTGIYMTAGAQKVVVKGGVSITDTPSTSAADSITLQSLAGTADYIAMIYADDFFVFTAPTAPTITNAGQDLGVQGGSLMLYFTAPSSDGGSPVTQYRVYVDGVLLPTQDFSVVDSIDYSATGPYELAVVENGGSLAGTEVQVSAVNAIGESPLSTEIIPT